MFCCSGLVMIVDFHLNLICAFSFSLPLSIFICWWFLFGKCRQFCNPVWNDLVEKERARELENLCALKSHARDHNAHWFWFWTIAHHHWGSDIHLVYKMRCIIVEQFGMLTASMRMNCKCLFEDLKSSAGLCVVFIVSCLLSHTAITIPNTLIPSDSIYFVFYSLSHIIFLVCSAFVVFLLVFIFLSFAVCFVVISI